MAKLTLSRKLRTALYGTGVGYTDVELARMFGTSPGAVRYTFSQLRATGFTVVKQLTRVNGVVGKAKYFMPKGFAEVVVVVRGRPAHYLTK